MTTFCAKPDLSHKAQLDIEFKFRQYNFELFPNSRSIWGSFIFSGSGDSGFGRVFFGTFGENNDSFFGDSDFSVDSSLFRNTFATFIGFLANFGDIWEIFDSFDVIFKELI